MRIEWEEFDGRMSHVICSPRIVRVKTGEEILWMGSDWDGSLQWLGDGCAFLMDFRRYAAGGFVRVMVDPVLGVFRIGGEQGHAEPLANLRARLIEEIEKTVRISPIPLHPDAQWRRRDWFYLAIFVAWVVWAAVDGVRKKSKPHREPPRIIREIPQPTR